MNGRIFATVCGLVVGAIGFDVGTAYGQAPAASQPERVATPRPEAYRSGPPAAYDPIRAAEQAQQGYIAAYGPWSPPAYRYALPYIYAYAPPPVARRVHGALDAYVPPLPIYAPWPQVYGYPYGPVIPQPMVPQRTWAGQNAVGYGPQYAGPAVQGVRPPAVSQTPTPANPATRPQPVGPSGATVQGGAAATSPRPPKSGAPEVIPAPPSEPGPREF
jgi:hypothetical protein